MTAPTEAMRQALEAMKGSRRLNLAHDEPGSLLATAVDARNVAAIAALEAALAEPQPAAKPLFWYRPASDGGYDGPLHDGVIEAVRKQSGAWVPLYATATEDVKPQPVADAQDAARADALMEQAQCFASTWSLVGGQFDNGSMLEDANEAKAELRRMVEAALAASRQGGGS